MKYDQRLIFQIRPELKKRLCEAAFKTGLSRSDIVRRALEKELRNIEVAENEN